MSGIFGYIGSDDCRDIVLSSLAILDHRGGESAGIALKINDELVCIKGAGTTSAIADDVLALSVDCTIALAQNGRFVRTGASVIGSSPACNNLFAVAMDGGVDNFDYLKSHVGNPFPINTDEDLVLAMLCVSNARTKTDLLFSVADSLLGDPTFAFVSSDDDAVYCKKGRAPLYVGIAKSGFFLSSELGALCDCSLRYFSLRDGELLRLTKDKATIFDSKRKKIKRTPIPLPSANPIGQEHCIADEVFYCPLAVKSAVNTFVRGGTIDMGDIKLGRHTIDRISRIIITGDGDSFFSAQLGAYNFGTLTDVPSYAIPANDLACCVGVMDKGTLLIAVSDNGESMPTIMAAKRAAAVGAKTIAITQNGLSYLARICDHSVDLGGDFDDNIVSLRSFLSQYLALTFFALHIGKRQGVVSDLYYSVVLKMAESLSGKVTSAVKNSPQLQLGADLLSRADRIIMTGMLGDYPLACEAGQKLRKIAGITSTTCPLNDLEHTFGTSLDGATVVAFVSDERYLSLALYHLRRARVLGATVLIYTASNIEEDIKDFDSIISINDSLPLLNSVAIVSAFYKTAVIALDDSSALKVV